MEKAARGKAEEKVVRLEMDIGEYEAERTIPM
jgi:hypothetical protein